MAKYTGSVSLVDMSDITATPGRGISHSEILYAISSTGDVPPELQDSSLVSASGDILAFSEMGTSFHVENNVLYGFQNGVKIELATHSDILTGIEGWFPNVPTITGGQFLWTKTIYYYTDGSQTITYGVYRWGADGKPGEQGPPGASASSYRISANQSEILKFVSADGKTTTFSPEILQFSVYKDLTDLNSPLPYEQVTGLSKERFSIAVYDVNSNSYVNIDPSFIDFDETLNIFSINLYNLNKDIVAFNILLNEESVIQYSYDLQNEEGKFYLVDYLSVRYGLKKDMAILSVEAGKIVQAIQATKLEFSAEGLTIQNGGFKIIDVYGNELLKTTGENLTVTGTINATDGYFMGKLEGATGTFRGGITAESGTIGGFNISQEKLTSQRVYIKNENGKEISVPYITLDGTTGKIIAQDITLGTGAIIEDYIRLGDAYIYNPSNHRDAFIQAGNIQLNQTGILKLGTIELHGGDTTTQAYIKSANGKWWIREDGVAVFNDIYADNVHLQDTILEIGTVQAMGSLMLFKDSWSIESVNNNIITVSGLTDLTSNDWIYSGKNVYKVISKAETGNTSTITLDKAYSIDEGLIITKFGQINTTSTPGFVFSILGERTMINDNREFASGNALTISDFSEENGTLSFRKRLVLGQLDGAVDTNITGLGLYADNVFLNGSLTTKVDDDSYAGINTIGEALATVFGDKDKSRIIFWAGSASSANIDIQDAPFQVTEMGSIYARKGIFRDSIISDSVIQGADIYAARIHGGTTEEAGELSIYDTSQGIVFRKGYLTDETEIFSIKTEGMHRNNDYFIEIKNNKVGFLGDSFILNTNKSNYLEIVSNSTNGVDLSMKVVSDNLINERSYQNITNDSISFGFTQIAREDSLVIDRSKTALKSISVWLEKDIYFGSGSSYMQYKKTQDGYDLFINE